MSNTTKTLPDLGLRGVPLLREILAQIDAKPELWNQADWGKIRDAEYDYDKDGYPTITEEFLANLVEDPNNPACGTAMCVAGWAVTLCGHPMKFRPGWRETYRTTTGHEIEELAKDLLHLTWEETGKLFDGDNTRDRIQEVAKEIAADRGETL